MISSFCRIFGSKAPKLDSSRIILSANQLFPKSQNTVLEGYLVRNLSNCNRAAITRIHRLQYLRQYPTVVVNPDGSTFSIRYHEPRQLIKLPVDVNLLSESARNARLERRKLKTKVKLEEDFGDEEFDAKKYLKFVKK